MIELSILVPTRNDAAVLSETMDNLNRVVSHNALNVETLVVDEESSDGTVEMALDLAHRYPTLHIRVLRHRLRHKGFGCAVRFGMAYARGRHCVLVSSDGQDPVELIPLFLKELRLGNQLVQCSRYLREEDVAALSRRFRLYQWIYRQTARLLVGAAPVDTTYGFRAFDRIFMQALGTSSTRFNICPEMTFKVILCGGKTAYVPGKPRRMNEGGQAKFQLSNEIAGYAYVLLRAGLHRMGLIRWF